MTKTPSKTEGESRRSPRTTRRVLIADDEPAVRLSLKAALECAGYSVAHADNGQHALELQAADPCELVILDLTMPVKSGWDTYEELSRMDPLLPVIILTARQQQLGTARAAGVAALAEKPIDISELLAIMEQLLGEKARRRLRRLAGDAEPIYKPRDP